MTIFNIDLFARTGIFIQTGITYPRVSNYKPILIEILSPLRRVYSNMDIGLNSEGNGCINLSNQCVAEGLNTRAGYSLPCVFLNTNTVIIQNQIATDFYNGAQVAFYNLSGGTGANRLNAIINNVSLDNDGNTVITFANIVTQHIVGEIALLDNYQAHSQGEDTTALARNSHVGGKGAIADLPGKIAWSDDYFNNPGDGQYSFTSINCVTTDNNPTLLAAQHKNLLVRNNMSYMFVLMLGARSTDGLKHAMFLRYGIIHNESNVMSLAGSVATLGTDINVPSWGLTVTATGQLAITVIGENGKTIHWKGRLDCIEIG